MFKPKQDKKANRDLFHGFYRGEVVDVNDPYKKGRIKIKVFGVFDELLPAQIPWAIATDPLMGGQGDIGGFIVPDQGSHVWVFFEEGDHTQPVYFAGAPGRPHGPSEATNGEYPRNKVFKTKTGFVFEIDDSPGKTRLHIHHPSGNDYIADDGGNVDEYIKGDVKQQIDGKLEIRVEESVLVSCPKIDLGEPSDLEQSVLGKKLEEWINGELVPWLNTHGHSSAPSGSPGPPVTQFDAGSASPGSSVWSKKNRNQ